MRYKNYKSVDDYITSQETQVQPLLASLRSIILKAAPKAEEGISYSMPGYKYMGVLVYFGAFKHHIGFFPGPAAIIKFAKELKAYEVSKGTIRFPLDAPLPLDLVKRIVRYRVEQNEEKAKKKKK